ncbi:MAG TPA: hypothetical protein VMA73_21990 [Streptosporangiaceae bacterium]|nr:hypothetical protein [Streptosporangiaceae bacterium]
MTETLYDQLQEHHAATPAGRVERLVPRWPDDLVFGPELPEPVPPEATTVHTCTRCWTQQDRGLPCWHCGAPTRYWEPPYLADSSTPVQVATTNRND